MDQLKHTEVKLPDFSEFLYKLKTFKASEYDHDLVTKIISRDLKINSFEEYVRTFYNQILETWNIYAVAQSLVVEQNGMKLIKGSFQNALADNEIKIIDPFENTLNQQKSLSPKKTLSLSQLHVSAGILLNELLYDTIKEDPVLLEFVDRWVIDVKAQQNKDLDGFDRLTAMRFPYTNEYLSKIQTNNYYFPKKVLILAKLYDSLVAGEFIEVNKNFEKLFEIEFSKNNNLNKSLWLANHTKTQLLFLIYLLNDKETYLNKQSIAEIAFDLFEFEETSTLESLKQNFRKAGKLFGDSKYTERNMKPILALVQDLF